MMPTPARAPNGAKVRINRQVEDQQHDDKCEHPQKNPDDQSHSRGLCVMLPDHFRIEWPPLSRIIWRGRQCHLDEHCDPTSDSDRAGRNQPESKFAAR